MKTINFKTFILVVLSTIYSSFASAQTNDEVTIVASGQGTNLQEATALALRSALEQTFGSFVSANTTILNDEVVKDEIISLSKGNVKKYDVVSVTSMPNNTIFVTLKATISTSNLASYAKSKGSTAEFAGKTFAMNLKLKEFRSKSTVEIYKNLCIQIEKLASNLFDYEINIGEPRLKRVDYCQIENGRYGWTLDIYNNHNSGCKDVLYIPFTISVLANETTSQIHELYTTTIDAIKLSNEEIAEYGRLGLEPVRHKLRDPEIYLPIIVGSAEEKDYDSTRYELSRCIRSSLLGFKVIEESDSNFIIKWTHKLTKSDKIYTYGIDSYYNRDVSKSDMWFKTSDGDVIAHLTPLTPYSGLSGPCCEKWEGAKSVDDPIWDSWLLPKKYIYPTESLEVEKKKKKKKKKKKENNNNSNPIEKPSYPIVQYEKTTQVIEKFRFGLSLDKEKISSISGFCVEKDTDNIVIY